jgi:creatinine amidohydrolase
VHGGDIETAMIHHHYPHLADAEKAKSLPPVTLPEDKTGDWLWGGHIKELSPEGYLGSPAEFEHVDVTKNVEDYASRISIAITAHVV